MPTGPEGEKRPGDAVGAVGAAVDIMRIAIGEEEGEREATANASG